MSHHPKVTLEWYPDPKNQKPILMNTPRGDSRLTLGDVQKLYDQCVMVLRLGLITQEVLISKRVNQTQSERQRYQRQLEEFERSCRGPVTFADARCKRCRKWYRIAYQVTSLISSDGLSEWYLCRSCLLIRSDDCHNRVCPLPKRPTKALPGTPEKIAVMIERYRNGQQLFHPDDASYNLQCDLRTLLIQPSVRVMGETDWSEENHEIDQTDEFVGSERDSSSFASTGES